MVNISWWISYSFLSKPLFWEPKGASASPRCYWNAVIVGWSSDVPDIIWKFLRQWFPNLAWPLVTSAPLRIILLRSIFYGTNIVLLTGHHSKNGADSIQLYIAKITVTCPNSPNFLCSTMPVDSCHVSKTTTRRAKSSLGSSWEGLNTSAVLPRGHINLT